MIALDCIAANYKSRATLTFDLVTLARLTVSNCLVTVPHATVLMQAFPMVILPSHRIPQVLVMRVLSVPLPASGTVDLVRGHPALTGGQLRFATYAGHNHPLLCDVEIRGHEVHVPDQHFKRRKGQQGKACSDAQELSASWYAQVSFFVQVNCSQKAAHQQTCHCLLQALQNTAVLLDNDESFQCAHFMLQCTYTHAIATLRAKTGYVQPGNVVAAVRCC